MLEHLIAKIEPLDKQAMKEAEKRWASVAKPLRSLGLLEDAVIAIAGMTGNARPAIGKKALVVMCADNGIVAEGVTQTGQEVTAIVTENFTRGETCACIMAEQAGVTVFPVDIGVAGDLGCTGQTYPLIKRKIMNGTKSFLREPAMTKDDTIAAIEVGIRLVKDLKKQGYGLVLTGEMGIGNTTTSSAVVSVLLNQAPEQMTGKGAGLTKEGLERKVQVICEAIEKLRPDRCNGIDVLSKVGGLDLAGLCGVFLGGAICRIPVVVDGFISAAAALTAAAICPGVTKYMLASHVSAEPAAGLVLNALGLKPVIYGNLCLGEGTGALTLVPLLQMALEVYGRMSTFEEIEVCQYQPL